MRLNRCLALLALAVATGIGLIWVEGQDLRLQQKVAELDRRRDMLAEEQARLRLAVSRLTAPAQVVESLKSLEDRPEPPRVPEPAVERPAVPTYLQR